jgi:CO dehydrogenase nickel-insertion accessory protein CooC1
MKVAILNYTGGVGKTTLAAHLLSPRMNNAPVLAIETINQTAKDLGIDTQQMSGDQFRQLLKTLILANDVIVDIGASNIEAFLNGMVKFEDSQFEFDCFLVPVTSGSKEQKETIAMVQVLSDFGIPPEKIRIVFNRVGVDVDDEFLPLINFVRREQKCTINNDAAIFENELFDLLNIKKMSIAQVLADETDYRMKAREAQAAADTKLATHCTEMHILKSLSKSVNRNLDTVYNALFN